MRDGSSSRRQGSRLRSLATQFPSNENVGPREKWPRFFRQTSKRVFLLRRRSSMLARLRFLTFLSEKIPAGKAARRAGCRYNSRR
jgi:hypothetical protein